MSNPMDDSEEVEGFALTSAIDPREVMFAVALLAAFVAITIGVAMAYPPAAWIVGGLLGALWAWLVLGDVK